MSRLVASPGFVIPSKDKTGASAQTAQQCTLRRTHGSSLDRMDAKRMIMLGCFGRSAMLRYANDPAEKSQGRLLSEEAEQAPKGTF